MLAVWAFLRGVPLLVWPLILVCALWLEARHENKSLRDREVVAQAERDRAVSEANQRANKAAFSYEEWKARQQIRTVYITRKVKDAIAADPVWSSASLPASVHDAIAAAASAATPAQSDGKVRSTSIAGPANERGATGKPGFSFGRLRGLFGEAPGAGASAP